MGYTYEEVLSASLDYFKGNELAAKVFIDKYALRNNDGIFQEKNPDDMHDRLAAEFARIDAEKYSLNYDKQFAIYRNAIDKFARICLQGSPMTAIGNKYQVMSASNCVVVASPKDNMGGIIDTGKELAQLFKRRCVEENSFVLTQEKGLITIKDVEIGMHIKSFDINTKKDVFKKVINKFETFVEPENRILIEFSNGSKLKTSKKHPVLTFANNSYNYVNGGELSINDVCVKPSITNINNYCDLNKEQIDIGWFVGVHIGDGTSAKRVHKQTKQYKYKLSHYEYDVIRYRILGDNENIVAQYADIFNKLNNSKANYRITSTKRYKTKCWEFTASHILENDLISEKYLDNQCGQKVYTAFTPSYIKDNNLWLPYIAGLIDTDGYIRKNGTIQLRLCAKRVIDEVSSFLISQGIRCYMYLIKPRKENEKIAYGISIHSDNNFMKLFVPFLRHNKKSLLLLDRKMKEFSYRLPMSNKEIIDICNAYHTKSFVLPANKKDKMNFYACFYLLKNAYKNYKNILNNSNFKSCGIGALYAFNKASLITNEKTNEILQRIEITNICQDMHSNKYIDLEVEDTNNFYAGNFGMINIHNCGVGLDISTLRPEGMSVNNAARTTSGAWSFADLYSYITRMVGQQSRRGALMITLSVHHPDVIKFATMKQDLTKVTGANISLRLSDEFLNAVENDTEYELRYPCEDADIKYSKYVKARDVWNVIIDSATHFAEPGLIMWQNMIDYLPAHCYPSFKTVSTNPCSEIALSEYDSCRLISINLTGYVNSAFDSDAHFDFDKFKSDIRIAQQMADNLVDLELELIDKIKSKCETGHEKDLWQKLWQAGFDGRRTGLGTHGLADALAQLRIKYDSNEALEIIANIYNVLRDTAYDTSCELAKSRGAFPAFDYKLEDKCKFIVKLPNNIKEKLQKYGRRNIALLTQAPTGSVSLLSKVGQFDTFNVSSGVEPVFRNSYTRRRKINSSDENARIDFTDVVGDKWQEFTIYHSNVANYLNKFNTDKLPDYFITSDQIDWNKRVELQGVEQQYIDHSISSTINLPKGTSVETVGTLYLEAWKRGLKGVTVYVDGCRDGVLISKDEEKSKNNERSNEIKYLSAPKRLEELQCDIKKVKIQGEQWTIFIGLLNDKPYEVFGGLSKYVDIPNKYKTGFIRKNGKINGISSYNLIIGSDDDKMVIKDLANVFENATYGAFGRTISLALRHGVPIQFIVEQLSKDKYSDITSFSKVMSRVLKSYIKDGTVVSSEKTCPQCSEQNSIIYQEGCLICKNCGYSKC